MNPSAGIIIADRYRLERPLGQGGMGAVWLAHHVGLRIPCAVKFILDKAAEVPVIRARFEREALAAAQIRSPHVVQILDHGIWAGMPYIAMEMLEGEDLEHRLARVGSLPPGEVLTIVSQVARALTKAHGAGLVHRDLKPANIFLVHDDDREIAKVLDFGIAKVGAGLSVDSHTKTGSLLGTPYYMSPEQAQGAKDVDHRSDLWALGVLTFQCLTGKLPFTSDALGELFMRIIVRPLPVPSQWAPVPAGFDGWWLRAASRDPAGRFQSARELAEALGVALGITSREVSDVSIRVPVMAAASAAVAVPHGPTPAMQVTPTPMGPPSGMSGSLAAAASSAPSMRVPAKRGAGLAAVIALGLASLLGAGIFVAWRMSARPVAAADGAPVAALQISPPAPAVAPGSAVAAEPEPVPAVTPTPAASATTSASAPVPRSSAAPVKSAPLNDPKRKPKPTAGTPRPSMD